MSTVTPRVVIVTRPSAYELLLERHATRSQAKFFLATRGQDLEAVEREHRLFTAALEQVTAAIPLDWRRNRVSRNAFDRFNFEPDDTIIAVGQDGLVANVAKYLTGQPVLGVNPDPSCNEGILVPLAPDSVADLLPSAVRRLAATESRTMVEATLDDGQTLLALNEVFIGHCSHQSARYRILDNGVQERHASSGIVVTTGTGATGWARSIHRSRACTAPLPTATESRLAYFVREAYPSVATQASLTEGLVQPLHQLSVVSEMNSGGVIFGDGIEADHLVFEWGMRAQIGVAQRRLELVTA